MRPPRQSSRQFIALTVVLGMLLTGCAHPQTAPVKFGDVYEHGPDGGSSIDQSRVLLLEFTDFECTYCGRSQDTIEALLSRYGDQLTVVTIHNPLTFHKNARTLAKLAVVAQRQGKLERVKRQLFEPYEEGVTEATIQAKLGMNSAEFEQALSSPSTEQRIEHQRRLANAVAFRGTPVFSINGHTLKGAKPVEEFAKIIDGEIEAAKEKNQRGGPWIKSRLKENAPDLYAYLFEGKEPPEIRPQIPKNDADADRVHYVPVDHERDAVFGPRDALVTVVSFTGFQCRFSKDFYPTLRNLLVEYPYDVRLHIKHGPLPFHRDSRVSAEVALCAKDQGKFNEMAELLFENHSRMTATEAFPALGVELARQLSLEMAQFAECMSTGKHRGQIDRDLFVASAANARGTPHTFVNGRKVVGNQPWKALSEVVDQELKAARAILAKGGLGGEALKAQVAGLYEEIISTAERKRIVGAKSHDLRRADKSDPIRYGSTTAKLKLTVFTDYQCPYCAKIEPLLEGVKVHYGDDLAIEIRHFPLSFHSMAEPAARAAQCAHEAGRGLEMHRLLMARQTELHGATWSSFADEVGVPLDGFESCMSGEHAKGHVAQDFAIGTGAGVRGTPSLYLHTDGIDGGARTFSPLDYSLRGMLLSIDHGIKQSPGPP
jgi:protein-disulfide isomerase